MRGYAARPRLRLARRLRGRGLEIGALLAPTPLPHAEHVIYSDVLTPEQLDRIYPGSRHPDIVSDSETFPTVADRSFDFVVANHVLEHLTRPLRALEEWHRLLRPGGLLLMAVPDKRFTFDHRRRRTPLAHAVADYSSLLDAGVLNHPHLLEWAEHVERLVPGTAGYDAWVSAQVAAGFSVHNHVWIVQDVLAMIEWLARERGVVFALEAWSNAGPRRPEFVLLLRAADAVAAVQANRGLRAARRRASRHDLLLDPIAALEQRLRGWRRPVG